LTVASAEKLVDPALRRFSYLEWLYWLSRWWDCYSCWHSKCWSYI